jgi:dipeptidyl aminopeptidase/acylaminoacyl peptidase
MTPRIRFGRWPSPLRAEETAAGRVSLSELCSDGNSLYWLESRPSEGGRTVFVNSGGSDLTPEGINIRSRVHEYGGGAVCLVPGHGSGAHAYVDLPGQRVWMMETGGADPRPLGGEPPHGELWAHGGLRATADGSWVLAVREAHRPGDSRPHHSLVALSTRPEDRTESVLAEGRDFYGTPAVNGAGDRLAVVAWDHPDMPWDNTEILVTSLGRSVDPTTGHDTLSATGAPRTVVGGGMGGGTAGGGESIGQPSWQQDGSLRFVSDRSGWWLPYVLHLSADGPDHPPTQMLDGETAAEFHGPDWVLSQTTMVELPGVGMVARRTSHGFDSIVLIPRDRSAAVVLEQPCVSISTLCRHGDGIAYIGGAVDGPIDVWVLPSPVLHATAARVRPRPDATPAPDPDNISVGEPFTLTGRSGRPVYGVFYPPALGGTQGPAGANPPLVVWCHGGPTSSAGAGFDITQQYFTSRGFAVARVDYAGSSGYGRDYRCSLWGQWGVADSEDCVDAARHLAAVGRVDGARMAIRGGSSGGLTALNALASGEAFAAAVALYGVTDLVGLALSTHDFEATYVDRLIGPLPEARATYEERSPVQRAAAMSGSVLLLQGSHDPVVPPAQAERLRDALGAAGRHCEVHFFEGESHGFRRAETLVTCLETELAFYLAELDL